MKASIFVCCIFLFCLEGSLASINKEPVRVTHKNSGPKYEFDNVGREPLAAPPGDSNQEDSNNETPPAFRPMLRKPESAESESNGEDSGSGSAMAFPIGQLSIRRVILVPVSAPSDAMSQDTGSDTSQPEHPRPFMNPFWPMMRHPIGSSLFGADAASRHSDDRDAATAPSPAGSAPGGATAPNASEEQPTFDPYQLMMSLLQNVFASHVRSLEPKDEPVATGSNDFLTSYQDSERGRDESMSVEKPKLTNETSTEVVEIDGQKYLRKIVVQERRAPGVLFMTKRLIFTPLNETDTSNSVNGSVTTLPTPISVPTESATTIATGISSKVEPVTTKTPVSSSESPSATQTTDAKALEKEGETTSEPPKASPPAENEKILATTPPTTALSEQTANATDKTQ